jgi:glycerol-3-phosphate acyltransferase PlsY
MKAFLLLVCAYLVGNIMAGHVFYGRNIRNKGSGNAGARNAGRVYGKKAFVITFFGDAAKGAAAVLAAKYLGLSSEWQLLALLAVITGHIFPAAFHFRGGKGMSAFVGGVLAFHPLLFSIFACIFLIFFLIIRSLTLAGIIAVFILPVIILLYSYSVPTVIAAIFISAIVVFAHRQNIKEKITH